MKPQTYMRFALIWMCLISLQNCIAQNIHHSNVDMIGGFQVNTFNGNLFYQRTDLGLEGNRPPIEFQFSYNNYNDTLNLGFGKGWTCLYTMAVLPDPEGLRVIHGDGRIDLYTEQGSEWLAPEGVFDVLTEPATNQYILTTSNGIEFYFSNPSHHKLTKVADPIGDVFVLQYAGSNLSSITDANGRSVQFEIENNMVSEIIDNNSDETRSYQYSYTDENLTQVLTPLNYTYIYEYSSDGIISVTDRNQNKFIITYTDEGAVKDIISCFTRSTLYYNSEQNKTYVVQQGSSDEVLTTFQYDSEGRLIEKTGNCCGFQLEFEYDSDNNSTETTDANGNTTVSIHNEKGSPMLVQFFDGIVEEFEYTPAYNLVETHEDPNGNITQYSYNEDGNLETIQTPGVQMNMGYNAQGLLSTFSDGLTNQTNYNYGANNNLLQIQYEIGSENFEYDAYGRITKAIDANGNFVEYTYDALDRVIRIENELEDLVLMEYDANDNMIKFIDGNGVETLYEYDGHDRLISVIQDTLVTKYEYDSQDNLVAIQDANGHIRKFTYDNRGLPGTETDAEGNTKTLEFDSNGNLTSILQANGDLVTMTYDALDRMTSRSYGDESETFVYDPNGNLIQCSNSNLTYEFAYDSENRLVSKYIPEWNKLIQYDYDDAGNRKHMIDPDGGTTTYNYDGNNRLVQIVNPFDEVSSFDYDLAGRLVKLTNGNGSYTEYTYDDADQVLSLFTKNSSNEVLFSEEYTYDANGNRSSKTDHNSILTEYGFDDWDRLIWVKEQGQFVEEYQYDNAGNRIHATVYGVSKGYTYDDADRLMSAGSDQYTFDANGNMTSRLESGQLTLFDYDELNRLTAAIQSGELVLSLNYDPLGNKVRQTELGVEKRFIYDGDNTLLELNGSNETVVRYTTGLMIDQWLTQFSEEVSLFFNADVVGSIRTIQNMDESIVKVYSYKTFGETLIEDLDFSNNIKFQGRGQYRSVGLYDFRFRNYDSHSGRFCSKDAIQGDLSDPNSLNKYTSLLNNPFLYFDPMGTNPLILHAVRLLGSTISKIPKGVKVVKNWFKTLGRKNLAALKKPDVSFAAGFTLSAGMEYRSQRNDPNKKCYEVSDILAAGLIGGVGSYYILTETVIMSKANAAANIIFSRGAYTRTFASTSKLSKPSINQNVMLYAKVHDTFQIVGVTGVSIALTQANSYVDDGCTFIKPIGHQNKPILPLPTLPPIDIDIIAAMDPNEIIGPDGIGSDKWVRKTQVLPYTVFFENDPDFATAPAQVVTVELPVTEHLNPYSIEIGDFGFGDIYVDVPEGVSSFFGEIDLTDSLGIIVEVLAGLNVQDSTVFWIFQSIDSGTGLTSTLEANEGFLPVNDSLTFAGEGFVNLYLQATSNSITGDTAFAKAIIGFDDNALIETNTAWNTIDADAPSTTIENLTVSDDQTEYDLTFSSEDIGSGFRHYILYASENGNPYIPYVEGISEDSYLFQANPDSTYDFYVIGVDSVYNIEALKGYAEPFCMLLSLDSLVDCNEGASNGYIELNLWGAVQPISYEWSHDSNLNSPIAENLEAGIYSITVTDATGCNLAIEVEVETIISVQESPLGCTDCIIGLYPNPGSNEAYLEFVSSTPDVTISIFDSSGKQVHSEINSGESGVKRKFVIDRKSMASGSYIIRITNENGIVMSAGLLKAR